MNKKRLCAVILGCALALGGVSGCSGGETKKDTLGENNGAETSQSQGLDYSETEVMLPSDAGLLLALNQLTDGSLRGVGSEGTLLDSSDGGSTWTSQKLDLTAEEGGQGELEMACIGGDGGVFLSLGVNGEEEQENQDHSHAHIYYYVSPEGEAEQVAPQMPQEDGALILGSFLSDTEVLAWYQADASFYQISMDSGQCKKLFEAGQGFQAFCWTGEDIVADAGNSLMVYNMELGTTTLVMAEGKTGRKLAEGTDKENFYLLNSQGIYLCEAKDGKGELIVQGNTNAIGNPSLSPVSFLSLDNGDFLAVFRKEDQTYQLLKYSREDGESQTAGQETTKEANQTSQESQKEPSSLEGDLNIYSLNDSEILRLAIAAYQKENPGVTVQMEVGVTGENAVTAADAIKTLNTELISGEGPDVIILDGLPVEDYIEKGVLEDVSSVLEEYGEGQLYEKIVRAYEQDGKIYAIPSRFKLPFLLTSGQTVSDTLDLEQVADAVEQYAEEEAGISIVSPITPRQMIESLYDAYMPYFYSPDTGLQEEKLVFFLEQAARIYEVRKSRISGEELARGEALEQESLGEEFCGPASGIGQWLAGELRVSVNHIGGMEHYQILTSLARVNGDISIQGIGKVYDPMQIVGLSAKSDSMEEGKSFLKRLLSTEIQESSSYFEITGFPVNREALENFGRTEGQENGDSMESGYFPVGFVLESEDPDSIRHEELEFYWPTDEEYQRLEDIFENLETPCMENEELKQAVVEQGSSCLEGKATPQEAVNAVVQEIRLQLME